jgi:hypothetical protein
MSRELPELIHPIVQAPMACGERLRAHARAG